MSPVFIGSDSNDSKIRSNRIGFAVSTTDPGSFSAGEVYYNSTDSQMKVNDGSTWSPVQGSGSFEAVASGTLSNGQTVVINTDGTVGIITGSSIPAGFGTAGIFENDGKAASTINSYYDTSTGYVCVCYEDIAANGQVAVGSISGDSIIFGEPSSWGSSLYFPVITGNGNGKIVVAWRDGVNSNYGAAKVGTLDAGNPSGFPNNGRRWSLSSQTGFNPNTYPDAFNHTATNYAETTSASTIGSITFDPPLPRSSITQFHVNAQVNGNKSQDWGFNGGTMTSRVCNGSTSILDLLPSSGDISSMEVRLTGNNGVAGINQIFVNGDALVDGANGPTVIFGNKVGWNSSVTQYLSIVYDSNVDRVVLFYNDNATPNGKAIVGQISGSGPSGTLYFGSEFSHGSNSTTRYTSVFDSINNKIVIVYRDTTNSSSRARVVTVTNTSGAVGTLEFGTEGQYDAAMNPANTLAFDSIKGKVIILYVDNSNSSKGTAIVGTVVGTGITFGTPTVFKNDGGYNGSAIFDSGSGKVVLAYQDPQDSDKGNLQVGTVKDDDTIDFGPKQTFQSSPYAFGMVENALAYDSANKKVIINFGVNGTYPLSRTFTTDPITTTNLTSTNFIGFSDGAYTNGQTAKVQIVSSIDDAQVGLTTGSQYYVQYNGTLSTSAGSPSVFAGTALSDTQISVKL